MVERTVPRGGRCGVGAVRSGSAGPTPVYDGKTNPAYDSSCCDANRFPLCEFSTCLEENSLITSRHFADFLRGLSLHGVCGLTADALFIETCCF